MDEKEKPATQNAPPDDFKKCEAERSEYLDGWKRAKADLINYKKEEIQRFQEFAKFSNAGLIEELISVMDSFDLSLKSVDKDNAGYKGLVIIKSQFEDILRRAGLEQIANVLGEKFNPSYHEAVSEIESDKSEGVIVEEVRNGYLLYGRVIRPARVIISKGQK
ncbi:MAG: nucleotide exchange factor GrpE [Patescibacteria group bacterium]